MRAEFEELDWAPTPIGELSLRRRRDVTTQREVIEVKLGEDYLMSSLFTVAEVELARLALARVTGAALSVAVGGLGLGYTTRAVLADPRVAEVVVVEALAPVIGWHERGLVGVPPLLAADPRCRLVLGDFFAMAADGGFDPALDDRVFDVILLDIDHSPNHLLAAANGAFYRAAETARLARRVRPGGFYGLWSNDPPDAAYLEILTTAFRDVSAVVVSFPNPLQDRDAHNTVYLATAPG